MSELVHWLIANIPGDDIIKGESLRDYIGCGPLPDSGLHRYLFVVYKQPGKLNFDEQHIGHTIHGRLGFKLREFASKYNLGDPIAGNTFLSQYDDSVPAFYARLGLIWKLSLILWKSLWKHDWVRPLVYTHSGKYSGWVIFASLNLTVTDQYLINFLGSRKNSVTAYFVIAAEIHSLNM